MASAYNYSTARNHSLDDGLTAILPVAVMSVEGLIGNTLLIAAIISDKKLRTYIDAFVCNVAILDLIVTGIIFPSKIPLLIYKRNIYSSSVCNFIVVLAIGTCTGSVVSLAAVSVNKYLYICHHNWYKRIFNKTSTGLMILFSWVYSFFLAIPPVFGWSEIIYSPVTASCTLHTATDLSYAIFFAIFGLGLPMMITTNCYGGIFLKIYLSRKKVSGDKSKSQQKKFGQLYTMFVISSLFSVSWFPYCILHFMEFSTTPPVLFNRIASWMGLANSCMNCVVLVVVNKNYQEAVKKLICCFCKKNRSRIDQSDTTRQTVTTCHT